VSEGGLCGELFVVSSLVRMTKRSQYLALGRSCSRFVTKSVVVLSSRYGQPASTFIGFTASKRVGKAVKRNRARRRLKELVRAYAPLLAGSSLSFVFIATKETFSVKFSKLDQDFLFAVSRCISRMS
jgi:ribonuclease P protein component